MRFSTKLPDGTDVSIVVRSETKLRLRDKCFRHKSKRKAGNFLNWRAVTEVFQDEGVIQQLLEELAEVRKQNCLGINSMCQVHAVDIGWESTAPLADYNAADLEEFKPNRRSNALRVRADRTHLLAPLTKRLTLVYELKLESEKLVAIVHSMYPGLDIGELDGDISVREQRVFFAWDHPGE